MGKLYQSNEDIILTPKVVPLDNDPAPPVPPTPTKPLTQFFTTGKVNAGKYMLDDPLVTCLVPIKISTQGCC